MKIKEVRDLLKVTSRTVSNYVRDGKIRVIEINKKHYDYNQEDVYKMIGKIENLRYNVTYARVSLHKQKNDLISQNDQSQEIYNLQNDVKDLQSKLENIQSQLEDVQSKIDNGEY